VYASSFIARLTNTEIYDFYDIMLDLKFTVNFQLFTYHFMTKIYDILAYPLVQNHNGEWQPLCECTVKKNKN